MMVIHSLSSCYVRFFLEPAKSWRIKGIPPLTGTDRMFARSVERRSMRSLIGSASAFLAETIAATYFKKFTPHFSHVPPWRCS